MSNRAPAGAEKSQISKRRRTVFPPRKFWEDPWETNFDLARLRGKAGMLDRVAHLTKTRRGDEKVCGIPIEREQAQALVDQLRLSPPQSARLISDAVLIGDWFVLPGRLEHLKIGVGQHLAVLVSTSALATTLYYEISTDALGMEELISTCASADDDDLDLLELTLSLARFMKRANSTIARLGVHDGGRKPDIRRNVAIALATQAAEEATDTRVEIQRPSDGAEWRFTNAPGRFVHDLVANLSGDSERVLVGHWTRSAESRL